MLLYGREQFFKIELRPTWLYKVVFFAWILTRKTYSNLIVIVTLWNKCTWYNLFKTPLSYGRWLGLCNNHRQLVRYEKNGLELYRYAQNNNIFKKILCKKCVSARWTPSEVFRSADWALIGCENFFSQNGPCRVSKCPSCCVGFKNVNLP
jgi:hypothetical protein